MKTPIILRHYRHIGEVDIPTPEQQIGIEQYRAAYEKAFGANPKGVHLLGDAAVLFPAEQAPEGVRA